MTHNIPQLIEAGQEERIAALTDALRSMLAVIHRDGGHHTEAVGVEQSCADAEHICHQWKTGPEEIARLEAEVAELRKDGERIDWLNGLDAFEMMRLYYNGPLNVKLSVNFGAAVYGDTVGEAIDKARAAEIP